MLKGYPISSWLGGVIVKLPGKKYRYEKDNYQSGSYTSVQELFEGERQSGAQVTQVQPSEVEETGAVDNGDNPSSQDEPTELPPATPAKSKRRTKSKSKKE